MLEFKESKNKIELTIKELKKTKLTLKKKKYADFIKKNTKIT